MLCVLATIHAYLPTSLIAAWFYGQNDIVSLTSKLIIIDQIEWT